MAEDKSETGSKKDRRESQNEGDAVENGYESEEPNFSDPEDFVDNIDEEGDTWEIDSIFNQNITQNIVVIVAGDLTLQLH